MPNKENKKSQLKTAYEYAKWGQLSYYSIQALRMGKFAVYSSSLLTSFASGVLQDWAKKAYEDVIAKGGSEDEAWLAYMKYQTGAFVVNPLSAALGIVTDQVVDFAKEQITYEIQDSAGKQLIEDALDIVAAETTSYVSGKIEASLNTQIESRDFTKPVIHHTRIVHQGPPTSQQVPMVHHTRIVHQGPPTSQQVPMVHHTRIVHQGPPVDLDGEIPVDTLASSIFESRLEERERESEEGKNEMLNPPPRVYLRPF